MSARIAQCATAPAMRIVRRDYAYFVESDAGETLHGPACHARSLAALERLQLAARQRDRSCLTCGQTFLSEGPGHRMCTSCTSLSLHDGWV